MCSLCARQLVECSVQTASANTAVRALRKLSVALQPKKHAILTAQRVLCCAGVQSKMSSDFARASRILQSPPLSPYCRGCIQSTDTDRHTDRHSAPSPISPATRPSNRLAHVSQALLQLSRFGSTPPMRQDRDDSATAQQHTESQISDACESGETEGEGDLSTAANSTPVNGNQVHRHQSAKPSRLS